MCELSYQQASNASLSIVRCCTTLAVSSFARAPPPRAGGGARGALGALGVQSVTAHAGSKILLHLPRTTRRAPTSVVTTATSGRELSWNV